MVDKSSKAIGMILGTKTSVELRIVCLFASTLVQMLFSEMLRIV